LKVSESEVIERPEVPVLYVAATGGPAGAPAAFERLERALGGPRGRRFLGWYDGEEYRACVARKDSDDPATLGLEAATIQGGPYARARHRGPPDRIHETFRDLLSRHAEDRSRPSLEDYRGADEIYALLPVRGG
jgi:DNA gyrase inhibitor GyrI